MAIVWSECAEFFVVCCEAGAAQVVSSFVKNRLGHAKVRYCLEGPANDIFSAKIGILDRVPLMAMKAVPKDTVVLLGRSFIPELERKAIGLAKECGLRAVAFLDHWVNYEESFIPVVQRGGVADIEFLSLLPDFVVAGDPYSIKILKGTRIPSAAVLFEENEYFKDFSAQAKAVFDSGIPAQLPKALLYVSEPVFDDLVLTCGNGNAWGYNEFDVFRDILEGIPLFRQHGFNRLLIRRHPNEPLKKYDVLTADFQARYPDFFINFSHAKDILEDFRVASLIIGVESMALVLGLMAGRPAVSYLPLSASKEIALPHEELIRIRAIKELRERNI